MAAAPLRGVTRRARPARTGGRPARRRRRRGDRIRAAAAMGTLLRRGRDRVVAIDGSAGQTRGCLAPGQARHRGPASPGCHRRQPGRRAAAARAPASLRARERPGPARAEGGTAPKLLVLAGDAARGTAWRGMAPLRADAEHLPKMMRRGIAGLRPTPHGASARSPNWPAVASPTARSPTCCTSPSAPRETTSSTSSPNSASTARSQIAAWAARTIPDGTAEALDTGLASLNSPNGLEI